MIPGDILAVWIVMGLASLSAQDGGPAVVAPPVATAILPVEDIRVGMRGYGLTVFKGDTIEPFAIEVVSVMQDAVPQRALIWILCPEPRMQHSGPVQAMSGSPIYVWPDQDEHELGVGGKLIGAFAMGFPMVKTCYAGVRPIASMRQVAERTRVAEGPTAPGSADLGWMLATLAAAGRAEGIGDDDAWRLSALTRLFPGRTGPAGASPLAAPMAHLAGHVQPLGLPLPVGSPQLRRVLAPLLEPAGLVPLAANIVSGKPPPGVDPASIRLEPGSVLAVPFLWGDMDLTALGTCTEVLPDGQILAFGHAMYGQGASAMPMATGYVHMVVPTVTMSFKLGGSAVVQGAIVRDEQMGIAGSRDGRFETASMRVTVHKPDRPVQRYSYTLVHHRLFTPMLAAVGAYRSVSADQQLPEHNTVLLRGSMAFTDGRRLAINSVLADTTPLAVGFELFAALATMANNPFQTVMVRQVELDVQVETVNRSAAVLHAHTDRTEYAPGQQVGINVVLQPYQARRAIQRIELALPPRLPDGQYDLVVASSARYFQRLLQWRPHLRTSESVADIFDLLQRMTRLQDDALYVALRLPDEGLALGRQELPQLPSSRAALFAAATASTPTLPYVNWLEKKVDLAWVPDGEATLRIRVRRDLARNPRP